MTSLFLGRTLGPRFAPRLLTLRRYSSTKNPFEDVGRQLIESGSFGSGGQGSGDHVNSVSREYGISLPNQRVLRHITMNQLKINNNPGKLNVMIAQCHCFDTSSLKYLDRYEHPFAKSVLNMYIKKKEDPLWYKVFAAQAGASPFPCRVAAKRIRHAFLDALAFYGYRPNGRKDTTEDSDIAALYGTVKISIADPKAACNTKFADIFEQAKLIVAGIEPILAGDKYGRHILGPRPEVRKPQSRQTSMSNNSWDIKKRDTRPPGTRPWTNTR
ncbi:hypothetical protein F4781DRAFT_207960 [Annulohypoxylon bovei var. microspora]|nr:hypothetical protein F4781DRAFT_207960 [Annulohypoxylon bovei var. microspora]